MNKKRHEAIDWHDIEVPDSDLQTDLSTVNLLEHITIRESSASQEQTNETGEISALEVIRSYTKDVVRIEIPRDLYNRIARAIKKANSRLSVPVFVQTILYKILNQENL